MNNAFDAWQIFHQGRINKFLKKKSTKHFAATGDASLCGVIVECDIETGLAKK